MYYRLGIGQPDPETFIELLKHLEATRDLARSLALNLSPSDGAMTDGRNPKKVTDRSGFPIS
jgi:hypothetical protein